MSQVESAGPAAARSPPTSTASLPTSRPRRQRAPGGAVLLPGEIERRTRAERLAHGIPLDPNTLDQLRGAARAVGLSDAAIDRGIIPMDTTRES